MSGPKCLNYEVDQRLQRERARRDEAITACQRSVVKLALLNKQCQAFGLAVLEPPANRSAVDPGDDVSRQADIAEAHLALCEQQTRHATARLEQYHRESEQLKVQRQQQEIQRSLAWLAMIPLVTPRDSVKVADSKTTEQGLKREKAVESEQDKKAVLQQKLSRTLNKLQAPTVAHQQLVAEITTSSPARAGLLLRELERDVTEFNKCWERTQSVINTSRGLLAAAGTPGAEAEAERLVRDAERCWNGQAAVDQLQKSLGSLAARLEGHQIAHSASKSQETQADTVPSFVAGTLAECLGELGYTVSNMGGQTIRSQVLVPLQVASAPASHGIRVEVDEQEIKVRAVRVGGQPDTGEDRAAEEELCSQLEFVKQRLAARGVKVSRVRGAAVGVVPMLDLRPPREEPPSAVTTTPRTASSPAARRAPTFKSMGNK